ncbi:MAG: gamma-glutamyltransferase family protein [Pseudomonadota bacterium]
MRPHRLHRTIYLTLLTFTAACQYSSVRSLQPYSAEQSALSSDYIVVTANPHATQAGLETIEAGGSAVDAAVAIQSVLSLVEPQSSGLAGGAFMMHYDGSGKKLAVYDGRERAPASATRDMFLTDAGEPFQYLEAKHSGLAVGVPSVVAMLELAHKDHGSRPWGTLFGYAEKLASNGFEVSPRLHDMIKRFGPFLPSSLDEGPTDAYDYFHIGGKPLPAGHLLTNSEYASALRMIAADPSQFYTGQIAKDIVEEVAKSPRPGGMKLTDLAAYEPQKLEALCSPYRDLQVCGPPPPSSWIAVSAIMSMLNVSQFPENGGPESTSNWQHFVNAQRLAYADRDQFVADPEFVSVPITGLMNQSYISERAALLGTDSPAPTSFGDPWTYEAESQDSPIGLDRTNDIAGTSHFVVVDKSGNVVSMTASVESIFGSGRMAGGMFLNNQLTDFSLAFEDENGKPIANAAHPVKRPRSSMSPTIVLDNKENFLMATGSPGGSNIIAYTSKSLIGVLEWGLTPQEAVSLPNVVARGEIVRVEAGTGSENLVDALVRAGFAVDGTRGENSGLSVVYKSSDGSLLGGVDPRREGTIAPSD